MTKRLKKIATIILLILVAIPVSCPFILLLKQKAIRKEAASRLEGSNQQVIYLAENDLHWVEKGKELIINGRLFDVKSITPGHNHLVKVTGLFDNDETSIVQQIRSGHEKNNSENGRQLMQFLQFQLAMPETGQCSGEISMRSHIHLLPLTAPGLPTSVIDILTPPPQA